MKNNKNPLNEKNTGSPFVYKHKIKWWKSWDWITLYKSCDDPDNSTDKSVIKKFVTTTILTATKWNKGKLVLNTIM